MRRTCGEGKGRCIKVASFIKVCIDMLPHVTSCYIMLHHVTSSITTAALKASIKQNVSSCEFDQLHKIQHLIVILVTAVCRQCVVIPSPLTPAHTTPSPSTHTTPSPSHPLPHTAPLLMHSQSMNGLRRSFLCRVKRTVTSQPTCEIASAPDTQVGDPTCVAPHVGTPYK